MSRATKTVNMTPARMQTQSHWEVYTQQCSLVLPWMPINPTFKYRLNCLPNKLPFHFKLDHPETHFCREVKDPDLPQGRSLKDMESLWLLREVCISYYNVFDVLCCTILSILTTTISTRINKLGTELDIKIFFFTSQFKLLQWRLCSTKNIITTLQHGK